MNPTDARKTGLERRNRRLHAVADARIELKNAIVDPTSTALIMAAAPGFGMDVREIA